MTMPSLVEALRPIDTGEAAAVKAGAFVDLAITRWLVPHDAAERERCLREQFDVLIRAALASGGRLYGIRETGRLVATALWTVHLGGEPTDPPGYDAALRSITGLYYPRFRALDNVFAATTPTVAHHHLDLLASADRGRGLGSRLLNSYLSSADRRRPRPMAALQASSPRAAQLYARHGFEANEPVKIPGSDGLHVFPMRRHPPAVLPSALAWLHTVQS
jgi:GNAT superfamily N-acetyltransferase